MAKRPTAKASKKREPDTGYSLATSTVSERGVSNYQGSYSYEDYALVARAISGTVAMAAGINAKVCTAQRLRLYRVTGQAERTDKRFWKAKSVPTQRRASRLKSWRGFKAAEYTEDGDGIEEVKVHPVLDLLNRPDPNTIGSAWSYNFYWFRQTAGRVYAYMGDSALGVPVAAYMLYPQYTRPVYDARGLIAGYWYGRSTTNQIKYAAEDVDYYRERPNAVNPLGAASWMQTIIIESELEAAALQSEVARWQNGSFPGVIIEANENTTGDQVRQMAAELEGSIRGIAKTGSPLILRTAKITQVGHKPNEMGYVPGQERVEKRIYDAAGIPESIYRLNAANLASAEVGQAQYLRMTIRPMINAAADEFTQLLLPRFGLEPGTYFFAYDDPVGEDVDATADRMLAGVLGAVVKPNEYRQVMGLEPLEESEDELRFQGQRLSILDAPPPPPVGFGMGKPDGATVPNPEVEPGEAGGDDDEGEGDGEGSSGKTAKATVAPACGCGHLGSAVSCPATVVDKAPSKGQLTARRKAWQAVLGRKAVPPLNPETGIPRALDAAIDRLAGNLGAWYGDAYKELANTVDAVGNLGNLTPQTLSKLADVVSTGLFEVLNESAGVGVAMVGGDPDAFSLKPEPAMQWARKRGAEAVVTVPATMHESLRGAISEGLEAGDGIDGLRDRIAAQAPDLQGWQAERIARTESSVAYQEGNRQAWGQLGIRKRAWLLAGGPCPVCEAWAGANPDPVPMDTPFTYAGESLMVASAHPNCRCTSLPVTESDEAEHETLIGAGPLEVAQ